MSRFGTVLKKPIIAAAIGVFLAIIFPAKESAAAQLFAVSGPHSVGTSVVSANLGNTDVGDLRVTVFQLWYPTAVKTVKPAPYFQDSGILDALIAENYYFQTPETLNCWQTITLPAQLDVPALSGKGTFPLLLLSPGLGVLRNNYSRMAAELASWGYVVVSIDHLYNGPLRSPEGRIIAAGEDPDADSPDYDRITVERAEDLGNIIQLLERRDFARADSIVRSIDFMRIGALGHSIGGVVAFEACATEDRISACVDMDGAPQASFRHTGIGTPVLFLSSDPQYSDEELQAKGREPAAWRELGEKFEQDWRKIFDLKQGTTGFYMRVKGTGHMSFSDAPQVMPDTITHFGGSLTEFEPATRAILFAVRRFFDAFLKGRDAFRKDEISKTTDGIVY